MKKPQYKYDPGDGFPHDWHVWDYLAAKCKQEVLDAKIAYEQSKADLKNNLKAVGFVGTAIVICVLVGIVMAVRLIF